MSEVVYCGEAVFPFDKERDKDLLEHYSQVALLLSELQNVPVNLETGATYRLTLEKVT